MIETLINVNRINTAIEWMNCQKRQSRFIDALEIDLERSILHLKGTLKLVKAKQVQLKLAERLNLTVLTPNFSVQCDGKVISLNWIKGQPNASELQRMKVLGFRWVLNKREYQRKAAGVEIDQLREFIKECDESLRDCHESATNNN